MTFDFREGVMDVLCLIDCDGDARYMGLRKFWYEKDFIAYLAKPHTIYHDIRVLHADHVNVDECIEDSFWEAFYRLFNENNPEHLSYADYESRKEWFYAFYELAKLIEEDNDDENWGDLYEEGWHDGF